MPNVRNFNQLTCRHALASPYHFFFQGGGDDTGGLTLFCALVSLSINFVKQSVCYGHLFLFSFPSSSVSRILFFNKISEELVHIFPLWQ